MHRKFRRNTQNKLTQSINIYNSDDISSLHFFYCYFWPIATQISHTHTDQIKTKHTKIVPEKTLDKLTLIYHDALTVTIFFNRERSFLCSVYWTSFLLLSSFHFMHESEWNKERSYLWPFLLKTMTNIK